MAKYLKNPSDEMIKLQAMKMQILSTHRFVLSAMDTRKQDDLYNIMSAPVYYLHAIEDSNKMAEYASSLCADKTDPDLQKLLTYEKKMRFLALFNEKRACRKIWKQQRI